MNDDQRTPLSELRADIIAATAMIVVLLVGGLVSMQIIDIFK